ncbi:MAG: hypothetical protein Hyperionvirus5_12 [Hyperionvirus sp.]|uniref:E3 ubiquitin-protein ligase LAP n=1 Tax=Hyperionvirus sp. TaxID=2487770 RepID=A0A3G5A7G9_9VIRU|nr:MAG: hypothetical protein Hyperionvirus5_12 [Hyperionvirus sp.]
MPHKRKINRVKKLCRICYGDNNRVDFIVPCECKGSMKYIHRECLDMSRLVSEEANLKCSICKRNYVLDYGKKPSGRQSRAIWINFLRNLLWEKRLIGLYLVILGHAVWGNLGIPARYNLMQSCFYVIYCVYPLLSTYSILMVLESLPLLPLRGNGQVVVSLLLVLYTEILAPIIAETKKVEEIVIATNEYVKMKFSPFAIYIQILPIVLAIGVQIIGGYHIYSIVKQDYYMSVCRVMGSKNFVKDLEQLEHTRNEWGK